MLDIIARRFRDQAPDMPYWSLRVVSERDEELSVRCDIALPARLSRATGVMVNVIDAGGQGYAATSDLSAAGLRAAGERAADWARATRANSVMRFEAPAAEPQGVFESRVRIPWSSVPLADKQDLLARASATLRGVGPVREKIVEWIAALWHSEVDSLFISSAGARVEQRISTLVPMASVAANRATETVSRTFGGHAKARQGGFEVVAEVGFEAALESIPEQAAELLAAPNCPSGTLDLVLAPDQMILQLHESIGHPLELDRILGDERNYAGTSFVTAEMFGSYRYGSKLLNVTFDPTREGELASFGWDDEGTPAERQYLIRDGVLLRGLGGATSQLRSGLAGVATSRASSWNRPPIDRMSNLNLEAGDSPFDELIGRVERGVYMETNCSWSIDDSRNKFQFGCEFARRIEDGRLREVVKKPGYRGISATFWRSLAGVGDASTSEVLGTPYCGKGEPNQIVRVGHASPACRFENVEVFGGE